MLTNSVKRWQTRHAELVSASRLKSTWVLNQVQDDVAAYYQPSPVGLFNIDRDGRGIKAQHW